MKLTNLLQEKWFARPRAKLAYNKLLKKYGSPDQILIKHFDHMKTSEGYYFNHPISPRHDKRIKVKPGKVEVYMDVPTYSADNSDNSAKWDWQVVRTFNDLTEYILYKLEFKFK